MPPVKPRERSRNRKRISFRAASQHRGPKVESTHLEKPSVLRHIIEDVHQYVYANSYIHIDISSIHIQYILNIPAKFKTFRNHKFTTWFNHPRFSKEKQKMIPKKHPHLRVRLLFARGAFGHLTSNRMMIWIKNKTRFPQKCCWQ